MDVVRARIELGMSFLFKREKCRRYGFRATRLDTSALYRRL